jgi:hypothetical protein
MNVSKALALVMALEGCAPVLPRIDSVDRAQKSKGYEFVGAEQMSQEERDALLHLTDLARSENHEFMEYMTVGNNGEIIDHKEDCGVPVGSFAVATSGECGAWLNELPDNIPRLSHIHTHPLATLEDPKKLKQEFGVVLKHDDERASHIENVRDGSNFETMPPSLEDILGIARIAMAGGDNVSEKAQLQVVTPNGVWSYAFTDDMSSPIRSEMKQISNVEDLRMYVEDTMKSFQLSELDRNHISSLVSGLASPQEFAYTKSASLRDFIAKCYPGIEQRRARLDFDMQRKNRVMEYQTKQFSLGDTFFASEEAMLKATDAFIEYAETLGVKLQFIPASRLEEE